jgi:hypothetical protein
MLRQPSVPKRIDCMGFEYTRSRSLANRPDWLEKRVLAG